MAYGNQLRMLRGYYSGRLTGLPDLSTNVAHILKSRREIPSGFLKFRPAALTLRANPPSLRHNGSAYHAIVHSQSVVLVYLTRTL